MGSCAAGVGFSASRKTRLSGEFGELPGAQAGGPREGRLGAPSRDLQRSALPLPRTMLLRHPHAAPRNALQRKMAGGPAACCRAGGRCSPASPPALEEPRAGPGQHPPPCNRSPVAQGAGRLRRRQPGRESSPLAAGPAVSAHTLPAGSPPRGEASQARTLPGCPKFRLAGGS